MLLLGTRRSLIMMKFYAVGVSPYGNFSIQTALWFYFQCPFLSYLETICIPKGNVLFEHFKVMHKIYCSMKMMSYLFLSKKGVRGLQVIRMLQGCFISHVIAWVIAFSCSLSGVYKYFFASVSSAAFLSSFSLYVSKSWFCHSPLVTHFLPLLTG